MKSETTQLHIYIDNIRYPKLAEQTMYLKNRRKLNGLIIKLLNEHFEKEKEYDLFEKEKQS